jgi:hypothetical protein
MCKGNCLSFVASVIVACVLIDALTLAAVSLVMYYRMCVIFFLEKAMLVVCF